MCFYILEEGPTNFEKEQNLIFQAHSQRNNYIDSKRGKEIMEIFILRLFFFELINGVLRCNYFLCQSKNKKDPTKLIYLTKFIGMYHHLFCMCVSPIQDHSICMALHKNATIYVCAFASFLLSPVCN